jgi:hypothetical protein
MEKKNKRQFILLIALLITTISLLFFIRRNQNSVIDPSLFKVEQLDKIDHVLLESGTHKTELIHTGGKWKVNRYDADKRLIDVLFATVEQAIPKREIKSKSDSIGETLRHTGTIVSFIQGNDVVKKFIAGGNAQKTQAYFQLPNGGTYIMSIPGYRVYVSGIFEADENMFRDKRVFNFNWRNFKTLEVTIPSDPSANFHVSFRDGYFGIDEITQVDTTRLNDYLDAVSLLDVHEYLSLQQIELHKRMIEAGPAFKIEVKDVASRSYELEIFAPSKESTFIVGRIDKKDMVVFNQADINRIARKKPYFMLTK